MKNVKILGTGCKKCLTLEEKVKQIISEKGLEADVEKVKDINKMMEYGIMMTPGLVVNEEVKSAGIIPKDEQIIEWLS